MEGPPDQAKDEGISQNHNKVRALKGKSCKGYLYYSSILKSKDKNPFCVGIRRTLPEVPGYIIGESEMEASKEGRNLTDFKYACVGYSVYFDEKKDPAKKTAELPFCVGIELLVDKRASTADHAPAHKKEDQKFVSALVLCLVHSRHRPFASRYEIIPISRQMDGVWSAPGTVDLLFLDSVGDDQVLPQPRPYKPPVPAPATAYSMGEEFLGRFTRNAGLVASGVARNMNRVGNYIKDNVNDMLYPYRRRPK